MNRTVRLVAATAMTGALLAGCSSAGGPRADVSATKAQAALAKGNTSSAISNAEAAVGADPRNAAYRAVLGAAYLEAGRFASAATSFDDAMKLGDNSPRTALSLSLAMIGQGRMREAAALLNDWEEDIAAADLGLALALAGQPDRGVHVMGNAIRSGDNTPKIRQNLAYAYALAGRWREARLMAEQDVPADKVGLRMQEWAATAMPEAWHQRVANMLAVPAGVVDAGQPQRLALSNSPAMEQLVAEASATALPADAGSETGELPALAQDDAAAEVPALALGSYSAPAASRPDTFEKAFAAPAPSGGSVAQVAQDAVRFVSEPVVQGAAVRQGARPAVAKATTRAPAPATAHTATAQAEGTHLVQLGSFASEQGARRAWGIYVKQHPELAGHQMVITQAVVRGKTFWRVAAGGFDRSASSTTCGKVKARGSSCFAYSAARPLPGTAETGVRMAMR